MKSLRNKITPLRDKSLVHAHTQPVATPRRRLHEKQNSSKDKPPKFSDGMCKSLSNVHTSPSSDIYTSYLLESSFCTRLNDIYTTLCLVGRICFLAKVRLEIETSVLLRALGELFTNCSSMLRSLASCRDQRLGSCPAACLPAPFVLSLHGP